ncbi:MAG: DedA family protein [Proteobacteria bacterium]|nr:DedA family protein [Pseudomonadota bacterium]
MPNLLYQWLQYRYGDRMLRKLYEKIRNLAGSEKSEPALAIVSFAEASFFPIPPDVMLLPMATMRPEKAWRFAIICTIASIIGGIFGYAIGMYLMDNIGKPLMDFYGYSDKLEHFKQSYAKWGAMIILLKGLTPIPFKLVTIASGLAHFNFGIFLITATITRAARFFLVAFLARKFGPSIEPFIEKQLYWVTGALALIIIFGFWVVTKI